MAEIDSRVQYLVDNGYEVKVGEYVSQAWELFKKSPWIFIGYAFVQAVASGIAGYIPFIGIFLQIFLQGALLAGFYIGAHKIDKGEKLEFGDFFKGFENIKNLGLANLIAGIFVILGILLLVVPGVYLAVAYAFVLPFIVFHKMEFWPAMEASRKVVTKQWFNVFLLALTAFGIALLGVLCCIVGIYAALPVIYMIYYFAFKDIVGLGDEEVATATVTDENVLDTGMTNENTGGSAPPSTDEPSTPSDPEPPADGGDSGDVDGGDPLTPPEPPEPPKPPSF